MKISVTQEDIDKGERYHNLQCPIAHAVYRAIGQRWLVGGDALSQKVPFGTNYYILPNSAINFIYRFDKKLPVTPFDFEMKI
jgi:hypothetical protein